MKYHYYGVEEVTRREEENFLENKHFQTSGFLLVENK